MKLEGGSILSDKEKQSVQDLAYSQDLPLLTDNRRWLFEKLLIHAVSKNMSKNTSMIIFSFTSGIQHYKCNQMKLFFLHILLFRPAVRNVMGSFQRVITVNRE